MEENSVIFEINEIYKEYLDDVSEMRGKLKPADGLLGFGVVPGAAPCHSVFSDKLEKVLLKLAEASPDSETVFYALKTVYSMATEHRNDNMIYLMLLAVHNHTAALIRFLTKEDAVKLIAFYEENSFPESRLPAQKKIISLLREQAGEPKKRKLFGLK